jgi:hypothetical protein
MAPRLLLRRALVGTSAVVATSALVLVPALGASAIDYDVDDSGGATYTAIQAAVDAAAAAGVTTGDRIVVAAGAYSGFTVNVDGLSVVGAGAADTVVTGTVVLTGTTDISGFTIQGQATPAVPPGPYGPSAVQMFAGSEGSNIHDNVLQNGYHGVYIENVDATSLQPTTIADNRILDIHADQGTGVWISNSEHVNVTGNHFENAVTDGNAVGVNIQCSGNAIDVVDNEFQNLGNAIVAISNGDCGVIQHVVIRGNEISKFAGSGAIYFGGNNIVDVTIDDNVAQFASHADGALVKFSEYFASTRPDAVGVQGIVLSENKFGNAPNGLLVNAGVDIASPIAVHDNVWCEISRETYALDPAELDSNGTDTYSDDCLTTLALPAGGAAGGGSSGGQLDTLAVTGSEPSVAALAVATLMAAAGVALVLRGRRAAAAARHRQD